MDSFEVTIALSEFVLHSLPTWNDIHFPLLISDDCQINPYLEQVGSLVMKTCFEDFSQTLLPKSVAPKRANNAIDAMSIAPKRNKASYTQKPPPPPLNIPASVLRPPNLSGITWRSSIDVSDMFAECILAGEKVFVCGVCNYKSRVRQNMRKHVACMHSDNPPCFRCSTCGNSFKEKNKLKLHYMKSHNLEEPVAKAAAAMAQSNK